MHFLTSGDSTFLANHSFRYQKYVLQARLKDIDNILGFNPKITQYVIENVNKWYSIIPNTGAAKVLTAGFNQVKAF